MGHKTTSGKTVPARPYLKPAVEDNKAEYMQIIKEVIEKVDGIPDVDL